MHCPVRLGIILTSVICLGIPSAYGITLHVTDDRSLQIDHHSPPNKHFPWRSHQRNYFAHRGNHSTITIQRFGHKKETQGFVKFDLSPLSSDQSIERATLRLWLNQVDRSGTLHLHEILADWDERTIRGDQTPPTSPVFDSLSIKKSDTHQFITLDVTTIVQGWIEHPATNFGIALVSDHSHPLKIKIDSKENHDTSHPMEIEVVLSAEPGIEGPPGPRGLPGPPGPQGMQGVTPALIMVGQQCPTGEFLTGFDAIGNILCGAPPPSTEPSPPIALNDANPGDVIITELMINPSAVTDGNGEWFELFNTRQEAIDMRGWTIEEESGNTHVIPDTNPIVIPEGGFLVLGNNDDSASNGGITVAYKYTSITLNNGGDTIKILDVNGEEIDRVKYETPSFSIPNGASLSLNPNNFDALENNDASNWCASTTTIGINLDRGTPGAGNDPC
ncbi:DNRLRE domain-containing protein [Candidatus Nitronereus thalassa]|uniref:DNRLRE domain-containing protein n=1 Tax=Candidatus Nitronereus thalassa TaxID=3020898 RepID=A0ABU3K382_9BACT|nr:DNRLRE domain-containing protein [Candidatus Nitronereus thalassa]MDT7040824.1 DNRLRE domain-containing protein [Candidatus Nitronereus thalassa]